MYFTGCSFTNILVYHDTTVAIYESSPYRLKIYVIWDSLPNCLGKGETIPPIPVINDSVILLVEQPVSSANYVIEGIKIVIYPNPVLGILNLEYPSSVRMLSLSLIDVKGRKIREFNRIATELDVNGIPIGQYFLKLKTDKGIITKKVLLE